MLMSRKLPRKLWIAVGVVLIGTVAASSVFASSELTAPGVVRVTSREVKRDQVDLGPRGRSVGDLLVMSQLLYNRRVTPKAIGHVEMLCTYLGRGAVLGGGSRHCEATFFLPKGRLFATGAVHSLLFYEIVVVGGTGIYDNVGGTLTATHLGRNPRRELFLFRLTV